MRKICAVSDCSSYCYGRGYCHVHYRRVKRLGTTELPAKVPNICSAENCSTLAVARNLCRPHYDRLMGKVNPNAKIRERHNMVGTPEYKAWNAMIERCRNPKCRSYRDYGARGIKVCDEWTNSFTKFYEDMGDRPSPKYSIDRIDNEGDYTPENCRWATRSVQQINQRVRSDNKSGHKGVVYDKTRDRWIASISWGGKTKQRRFTTKQEAIKSREKWETLGLVEPV